jgi:hypothetical protein
MERVITIARRYCGPPRSANGGYAAGVVAEGIDGAAAVTLRLPPPLDTPMTLTGDGGESALMDGDRLVGEAIAADLDLAVPEPPSFGEATAASQRYVFADGSHLYPTCFVCGTDRADDGLHIFPGPLDDGSDVVAAPWIPDLSLGTTGEPIDTRYVWSALDCPSYFGIGSTPLALLGRITVRFDRVPVVGERLIAMGWPMGADGRKLYSGSALATAEGEVIARAAATWIEVKLPES